MILTFGEKLKLLRENAELTQSKLGKTIYMTQQKISRLENGKCEPCFEDIQALCRYFNISADYLLGFSQSLPYPKRNTKL